jgi:lipoyl(octanoyl) transferase
MRKIIFEELGTIDYKTAWDYQEKIVAATVAKKTHNRKAGFEQRKTQNYFLFCEHPHVYTLGKSGDAKHLLLNEEALQEKNAAFYETNRGGDITYHGPGQIVGYPILDLDHFYHDTHRFLRELEEIIICSLADFNIHGQRYPGFTGVWIDPDDPLKARKICAVGVRCSRWVTMHGFALNVNTDLAYFNNIIPCGINDKQVTSMQKELGAIVDIEKVKTRLKKHFLSVFESEKDSST